MTRSRELAEFASAYDSGGSMGFRNRIINGDMRIDQRNAGASVAVNENGLFTVDRWRVYEYGAPAVSAQQVSDAPGGFFSSLRVTVTTAGSLASSDFCAVTQPIEANNLTDFGFGTSGAVACSLSFWVKSSLTGTFSGTLTNDVGNYGYGFTYTISTANTWEYKTVAVPASTGGAWNRSGASLGMQLFFSLGAATNRSMSSGAWGSTSITATGVAGSVSLVGTSGATFYITGVQLEAGSVATPFERRPYGTELALCQRYFELIGNGQQSIVIGGTAGGSAWISYVSYPFAVAKRANPTMAITGTWTTQNATGHTVTEGGIWGFRAYIQSVTSGSYYVQNSGGSGYSATAEL